TQGDFFGEIGAVSGSPRSATCVAYVHPRPGTDDLDPAGERWRREEERVELVRVPRELLLYLMKKYPSVRQKVGAEIQARRRRSQDHSQTRSWEGRETAHQSDRFQELGLVQGQKLMVIDLDRCTRCDECVRACIDTHPDGRTRLFLDGPRFGRHLIPTTCRACRDPVCMIGCPVGSIRRGNNLEIVIEDWCIGCQLCAKNCPYGSIQMHDLGLVPQEGHDWQVRGTGGWQDVRLPVLCDADLDAMAALLGGRSLEFRRTFDVDRDQLSGEGGLKLIVATNDAAVQTQGEKKATKVVAFVPVALNGEPVPAEGWKVEQKQYVFELTGEDRAKYLRRGRNTLTVKVTAPETRGGVLLQVALDEVRPSGAVIPLKAVVCDQCSSLPGRQAACVHACPHDAAKRVDAWGDAGVW
ncbi:MAG: 4Fe-4S binding protein, partial [Gemmataceae bacterium]